MVDIAVVTGDITHRPCDLLVLKHADGFYGVDELVAICIGFDADVENGAFAFAPARNIAPRSVLFLGVGDLFAFRYAQIRSFARKALKLAAGNDNSIEVICSPLHGVSYGLDEREAFLSLVAGFLDAIASGEYPRALRKIEIVELENRRAERMSQALDEVMKSHGQPTPPLGWNGLEPSVLNPVSTAHDDLSSFGAGSEKKAKVFVAMPFSEEHSDVWDIAVQESCSSAGILCERLDEEAYTGDIMAELKERLRQGSGVVALLDGSNPNVFLEIGLAWGMGQPTVLMAKKGSDLPFDVRGQKCLHYTSIANLRTLLTSELNALIERGVFDR
jgi:hypothetical protein